MASQVESLANSMLVMGLQQRNPVIVLLDHLNWKLLDLVFTAMEDEHLQKCIDESENLSLIYGEITRENNTQITYRIIRFDQLSEIIGKIWVNLRDKLANMDNKTYVCLVINDSGKIYGEIYQKPWL